MQRLKEISCQCLTRRIHHCLNISIFMHWQNLHCASLWKDCIKFFQGDVRPESGSKLEASRCYGGSRWWREHQRWGECRVYQPARPLYVQVLQYDGTAGTWSEIGRMQKARYYHAVAEVDGALFCPVGPTNKITIVHHHLIIILSLSYVFIK